MTKQNKSALLIDKRAFLLPKMEFYEIGSTGQGFYLKELGGKALLAFKEAVEKVKASATSGELEPSQAVDLMVKFIVLSACDKDGNDFFNENDVAFLANKTPNLLVEIANRAMALSGIDSSSLREVAVDLKNAQPASSATD
jgi:hypothetical protein